MVKIASSTDLRKYLCEYLRFVECRGEVIVTKNGKEIGRLIPKEKSLSYLTDSLTGILKEGNDYQQEKVCI